MAGLCDPRRYRQTKQIEATTIPGGRACRLQRTEGGRRRLDTRGFTPGTVGDTYSRIFEAGGHQGDYRHPFQWPGWVVMTATVGQLTIALARSRKESTSASRGTYPLRSATRAPIAPKLVSCARMLVVAGPPSMRWSALSQLACDAPTANRG